MDYLLGVEVGCFARDPEGDDRQLSSAWRMNCYLAILGVFAVLEVCVTQAAPGKIGLREFLITNGFVIVMSTMHTVQVNEIEYHQPGEEKHSRTLGIDEDVKGDDEGFEQSRVMLEYKLFNVFA
jgi:hypothetical protein